MDYFGRTCSYSSRSSSNISNYTAGPSIKSLRTMELPPGLSEMERVAELCFRSRDGTAALETWLAGGADPDERDSLGNTMFSSIVLSSPYREQVERVRILIKYGASVDLECQPVYFSPLHLCAMQQNHACMALLLDAGADINKYAPNGWTPLMAAATSTVWPVLSSPLGCEASANV